MKLRDLIEKYSDNIIECFGRISCEQTDIEFNVCKYNRKGQACIFQKLDIYIVPSYLEINKIRYPKKLVNRLILLKQIKKKLNDQTTN